MGLEFRQRGPAEYASSIWRRKWLILLPALAIATAVTIVVMRLPNVYESSALLVVKSSSLTSVIPVTDPAEMTRRLNSLTQIVTSRTSLEPLIKKHALYKEERARGMSMDAILAKMVEKDLKVELSVKDDAVNGFTISYRGRDPRTAKAVTEELAGKCVSDNEETVTRDVTENQKFFEEQRRKYQEEMDAIGRERLEYLRTNLQNLPTEQQAMVEQLSGLRDQQRSLYSEIGRLRDQATMQANLLGAKQDQIKQQIILAQRSGPDISSYPVYAELVKQKTGLENELRQMLKSLKEKNPDVIAKREQIANVEKQIEQERTKQEARVEADKRAVIESLQGDTPETTTIRSNITALENERRRQEALLAQVDREIISLTQRLSNVPGTQVNLDMLDRRFQTAKSNYDALVEQERKVNLLGEANKSNRGESITLQDAANLPQTPVAPKRPLLIGVGVILGLGLGLFCAMILEAPRFFTIQTMDDAEHYTGLPVWVALPEFVTAEESVKRPRIRLAWLAAGLIVSLVSVPILVKALTMTHLFERFVL